MKKYLISIILLLVGLNLSYSMGTPGSECGFSDKSSAFAVEITGAYLFVNLSNGLPGKGEFGDGTCGWKIDTSGGGQVLSYGTTGSPCTQTSNSIYGEIGLKCGPGQTVSIDIATTFSTTTGGGVDWDYLDVCVNFRANTMAAHGNDRIAIGKFYVEFHDAYDTQIRDVAMFDTSFDTTTSSIIGTDSTFLTYANQPAQAHQNWFATSHVKLVYTVPTGAGIPTSEILIDQIVVCTQKYLRDANE